MKSIESYIQTARKKGKSDDEIKQALITAGWDETQALGALQSTSEDLPPPPPPPASPAPTRPAVRASHAWDAFEHILLFISMGVLAISIGLILHYFVDRYFPNVPDPYNRYSYGGQDTALRGYLASLIVSLPLFCFFFLDIARRTMARPEIRNLMARKVLIYLTLIITFVIMLGYVIAAVYSFLGGDVTLNFALHLLATFVVAGVIFAYYLGQVKGDRRLNA